MSLLWHYVILIDVKVYIDYMYLFCILLAKSIPLCFLVTPEVASVH